MKLTAQPAARRGAPAAFFAAVISAAAAVPASAQDPAGVVPSSHFEAATAHLDLGGELYGYFDIDGDLDRVAAFVSKSIQAYADSTGQPVPVPPGVIQEIAATLGLGKVTALGVSSVEAGDVFRNKLYLAMPGGRDGLLAVFGGEAHAFEVLEIAPANTLLAHQFDIDLAALYGVVKTVAAQLLGGLGVGQVEGVMGVPLGGQPGMPTGAQVVQELDTTVMLVVAAGEGEIVLPAAPGAGAPPPAIPRPEFVVTVDNLGKLLPGLRGLAEQSGLFRVTETAEALDFALALPRPEPFDYLNPILRHEKATGRLILESNPGFYAACREKKSSVRDNPDFKELSQNLPTEGNSFSYISTTFTRKYLGVVRALAGGWMGAQDVPDVTGVLSDLIYGTDPRGTVSVGVNLEGGVLFASNGPVSMKASLMAAPVGLLGAMAVPAFVKVRTTSQEKTIQNNLRQIASGCDQFFIETGKTTANPENIFGNDNYIRTVPDAIAGEDYLSVFPVSAGFTELSVTTADGRTVTYSY